MDSFREICTHTDARKGPYPPLNHAEDTQALPPYLWCCVGSFAREFMICTTYTPPYPRLSLPYINDPIVYLESICAQANCVREGDMWAHDSEGCTSANSTALHRTLFSVLKRFCLFIFLSECFSFVFLSCASLV